MNKELKNDLIVALNEVKEAHRNIEGGALWEASDRLDKVEHWLEKYVSAEDKLQED